MSMIMHKSDPENPRANEKFYINQDVDLNDLLRTFNDDPNDEVKHSRARLILISKA